MVASIYILNGIVIYANEFQNGRFQSFTGFKKKIELSHKYYSTTGVAISYTEVISLFFPN